MITKLKQLAAIEGFHDPLNLLLEYGTDSICPGICTNPGCDFSREVEPDQTEGFCEECNTQTVVSAMVLAGVI